MNNDNLKYGVVGLLIGGVSVWFLAASAINSNNPNMLQMMGMRSGVQNMMKNSSSIDAHFIEQMIPHHEDAITMAELAQTKATKPEVKQLAKNIIALQGREINQMKSWYKNWYGKELQADDEVMNQHGMMDSINQESMHMGMMGNLSDTVRLETAADFDRAFVEDMIPHHQMAVMMARMLKNGTQRPEMQKLADDIITAQTNEITQMREWLQSWSQ